MNLVSGLLVLAAVLPYGAAVAAKAGGAHFDNNAPRAWLAAQHGWRARADAAQANLFESLPFFFAAVLYALYSDGAGRQLVVLMAIWIVLRILYMLAYIAGRGTIRSSLWGLAFAVNLAILLG